MNKHTRFIVSVLFMMIIVLAAGITRFYSDMPARKEVPAPDIVITQKLAGDSAGNRIFRSSNGLYGICDDSGRIILNPDWKELSFTQADMCIAKTVLNGSELTGCIDYEGNVTIPFIYRNIQCHENGEYPFYTAETFSDNVYVIYDIHFSPCFPRVWESCSVKNDELLLSTKYGKYTYTINENGFSLKKASVQGSALECGYSMDIYSRILLSKLSIPMIEKITSSAGRYLEYAFGGKDDILDSISSGNHLMFHRLFEDEKRIISMKLKRIPEVFVYSVHTEDTQPHYAVSVTADTEIVYSDKKTDTNHLYGSYRATIEFTGSSENDLTAISGSFSQKAPDYPEPEPAEEVVNLNPEVILPTGTGNQ